MLVAKTRILVRVGERVDHREVAAGIHASLASLVTHACWIHAQDDLSIAFRFAVEHRDLPLIVTTSSGDWSAFENDRAWNQRSASSVFVVPSTALQRIPPQVSRLLGTSLLVRRNPAIEHDEELRPLRARARVMLANCIGDDIRIRKCFAEDVGLDHKRIDLSGPALAAALELINESVLHDQFEELVAYLDQQYSHADTNELTHEVRRLYQRLEG